MDYGLSYPFKDFSSQFNKIGSDIGEWNKNRRIGNATEGVNGDWNLAAQRLLEMGYPDEAARFGALGIASDRNSVARDIATTKANGRKSMTPTDKKLVAEAQDEIPGLQGTIENLDAALAINDKTFQGASAGARAWLGSRLPDEWVPDQLADKRGADVTTEWQSIMSPNAISQMSASLKGATTDFELRRFEALLADPSTPPKTRANVIKRMRTLAERHLKVKQQRIQELQDAATDPDAGGAEASGEFEIGAERDSSQGRVRYIGNDQWELIE
jgi:hypothetical protein